MDVQHFREWTKTPARRHNLYNHSTKFRITEGVIFFILTEMFRQDGGKRQADLINKWFIQDDVEPELFGFVGSINLTDDLAKRVGTKIGDKIDSIGRTWEDKKGGFTGWRGNLIALKKKLGNTKLSRDMFEPLQSEVAYNLTYQPAAGFGSVGDVNPTYNPDLKRQPERFTEQAAAIRKYLKDAGFDPMKTGIY